ncbi:MAG: hypothetical protein KAZ17_00385 [Sphingorhabdus sp.]|nr:hypothetical protein [Sphingorhabdus sp.]
MIKLLKIAAIALSTSAVTAYAAAPVAVTTGFMAACCAIGACCGMPCCD